MSAKEYLKMSDAFVHNDVASLEQHIYAGYMSMHACEHAAHAISSHDELVKNLQTAESTLDEVERVLSESQKNGNYDFDDLLAEVVYAIKRIGEDD